MYYLVVSVLGNCFLPFLVGWCLAVGYKSVQTSGWGAAARNNDAMRIQTSVITQVTEAIMVIIIFATWAVTVITQVIYTVMVINKLIYAFTVITRVTCAVTVITQVI